MTRFYLLVTILAFSTSLSAQVAPDFEFLPDSVSILVPSTVQDSAADLEIHSMVATDISVKWQRNVLMITPGCQTQVCDLNACYNAGVNTKIFPLGANSEGPISIHLINTTGSMCQAVIRLDMWNVDVPSVVVPAYYVFNATSSINDIFSLEAVKVFPNPTSDYFTIQNDKVARVRMMTLDAREVANFNVEQTKTCMLNGQSSGMYVLLMEDNTGKAIGVAQLDVK
jgi:hypothetical protein